MSASFRKLVMVVLTLAGMAAQCDADPAITAQPKSQSVSLGATVTFQVTATGTAPWTYQWRMNDLDLFGATANSLVLTNAQLSDAGTYTVLVGDATGAVVSQPAELEIDPTFSKIVSSPIVEDRSDSLGCAWGDFDNDDWLDLVVANGFFSPQQTSLYRNNSDGSFTKILNGALPTEAVGGVGVAWVDYDNDGNLDLFSSNNSPSGFLYLNDGQGNLVKSAVQPQPAPTGGAGAVWADFDNDGRVDLFVARGGQANREHYLYRNNPDHSFTAVGSGSLASVRDYARMPTWADYDNDGDLDLFTPNAVAQLTLHVLYRNNSDGGFTRINQGSALNESSDALANGWADYDNDGDLDLFVANGDRFGNSRGSMQKSFLYQNHGDGSFVKVTNSVIVDDLANSMACGWGDYDNDGFIDLFVGGLNQNNRLYRNLGGGLFEKITTGSLVNDGGPSAACAWADFNNDGFLDLFVANADNQPNFVYRNNGNNNAWLKIKCEGTASNRSAIGAKVWLDTTIRGEPFRMLREITGGDGRNGQALVVHFGLGDALVVNTLRIEWPSGTVQEIRDVPVKKLLKVTEPPRLNANYEAGQFLVPLPGGKGHVFEVQESTNLTDWTTVEVLTNVTGNLEFRNPELASERRQFYRTLLR